MNDLVDSLTKMDLTRRGFLVTTLAAGFALAVQPVGAQTIHTDSVGLIAGEVQVPTPDGQIPAYRALPAQGKTFPVILVVQEIFGVHEHIKDICRRFAKRGYYAIAPELYARQGDVSKMTDIQQIITQVVSKVPDDQVMSDLDASVGFAAFSGQGDISRLGITGFCWGGRIVWLYAEHSREVKAAVAWYGSMTGTTNALHPSNPIDGVTSLKAPVLGLYGGADPGNPQSSIDQMRTALAAAHNPSEIVVYPDAPHGFHADYRPSYRPQPAQDGDNRMYAWFEKYGVAPDPTK